MTLVLLKCTVSQGSMLLRAILVINLIEKLSLALLIMRKINQGYQFWLFILVQAEIGSYAH